MNNKTGWAIGVGVILLVLIAGIFFTGTHKTPAPQTATTTQAIPGDNLTLGEDGTASLGKFLIGYNGMTLYTFSQDSAGKSACMGTCTNTWIPYVVTSGANLVAESPVAGKVSTLIRADGSMQVTYNGKPLYFYSGDHANEDTNGVGVSPAWTLAQP